MLVPEIALTPQAVGRFQARFGERIALLHSGMTEAERRDERERIVSGEARVVVGARSAVFAPVRGLGLVVVDEEHDPSYKQESDPRYDARTVAAKRAALEGAVAVFGSATPRPESWAALERLDLGGRLTGKLPPVRDRRPAPRARLPAVGAAARRAREGRRARREGDPAAQPARPRAGDPLPDVRRHPPLPELRRRAGPARRGRCAATTAATRSRRRSSARSAGRPSSPASARGHSGSSASSPRACPSSSVIRLDADTKDPTAALERFAASDRAVLLGTQMVAKGHHFEGVALAAVVDADTGLANARLPGRGAHVPAPDAARRAAAAATRRGA